MTRQEFINDLRESLYTEVSSIEIESNIKYYNEYINEQIRNGKSEEQVLLELGDPRLIARTIIETSNLNKGTKNKNTSNSYQERYDTTEESYSNSNSSYGRTYHFDGKLPFKYKAIGIAVLILILLVLVFVTRAAIVFLVRFGIPLILVYFIAKMLRSR